MKTTYNIFVLFVLLFAVSCASNYRLIEPTRINYLSTDKAEDVELQYKYVSLGGRRYAKKVKKKDIRLVSLQITNNSDNDLVFGRDVELIYGSGAKVILMPNEEAYSTLKQGVFAYLLYLLLFPTDVTVQGATEVLVLSTALTFGNMYACI